MQPCLSLLVHDDIERVICEWHEDYVVCYGSGVTVLVSVKHLEESQPRWTIRGVCIDGGIAHLFDRWRAAEERATCLLQTNTQMRTGNGEPAELRDCCASGDELCLARWAETLTPLLAAAVTAPPTIEEVARFLAVLRIEDDLPKRSDIGASNLADAMPRVTSALGRPASDGPIIYETVVRDVGRRTGVTDDTSDERLAEVIARPSPVTARVHRPTFRFRAVLLTASVYHHKVHRGVA